MNKSITDMTYGNPAKHILLFALPALIGNIFQQIYNLADSIIVGRFIGADAFAAVGATSSITFLFFALCNGIESGGGIVVKRIHGLDQIYRLFTQKYTKVYLMQTTLLMEKSFRYP